MCILSEGERKGRRCSVERGKEKPSPVVTLTKNLCPLLPDLGVFGSEILRCRLKNTREKYVSVIASNDITGRAQHDPVAASPIDRDLKFFILVRHVLPNG